MTPRGTFEWTGQIEYDGDLEVWASTVDSQRRDRALYEQGWHEGRRRGIWDAGVLVFVVCGAVELLKIIGIVMGWW